MTTRRSIAEASRQLDEDLSDLTSNANEKELAVPWIPRTEAKADARAKPHTETQAAQIARIAAMLEKHREKN